MKESDKEMLKSLVLDLELLVVSVDRLKRESADDLVAFLGDVQALDRLARHRSACWDLLERVLSPDEIEELRENCESVPLWTPRKR